MKRAFPMEFVFQVFALIIAIIIVHAIYVAVVRPNAEVVLREEYANVQADPSYVPKRSAYVVVKDFEQETCFILMLWAFSILGFKGVGLLRQRKLLEADIMKRDNDERILPQNAQPYLNRLASLSRSAQSLLLPRALRMALQRFDATKNIQAASTLTRDVCESEAERLESELSIIRYIAWAIPSIGFIGTVRGIGDALGQAHKAVEGDITGVTQSLGVAFNSTFIALVISIVLMFFIYQLQLMQERLVLDVEAYCDDALIRHLRVED